MKISIMALSMFLGIASSAIANDQAYFEIKKVTVRDVTEQYVGSEVMNQKSGLFEDCGSQRPLSIRYSGMAKEESDLNPLNSVELIVDQIINIGKKIFNVVAAGKPVVNIKMDTANALPAGLTCWSDLTGWNVPNSKVYNVVYENSFGMSVIDFSYRVVYTAGGSADGVGKYITNATFMPANLSVGWGFKFDAVAQIPAVFNTGSKRDPVAGMQMNMAWKVTSPVAHEEATESYFVSGENKLIQLN